jgi:signal transduction histidine kinase
LIVGIPSAVALLGSALALSRVSANYRRARFLERANASSSLLIQAAATQAKERGFTAASLSDPGAQVTRGAIPELRATGDRLLNSALLEAQPSLNGNRVLSATYRTLLDALANRDRKRTEVDAVLARGQPANQGLVQDWFNTQTDLIGAERAFGGTLFLAENPYELVIQYNGAIKANVFVASEFAGRERARIGRFIASGQPIPPERLEELQRWRGVVEENLAAIAHLRANPAMSPSVLRSIDNMESVFLGDYQKAREKVYAASARREPYPLTTDDWIAASTRGIDSILEVSNRIGEEAARISHQQAVFSLANVLVIVAMIGLLALAIAASVLVARTVTRRLADLRAAAERVSEGNYSREVGDAEVGEADVRGKGGDEFAILEHVFNAMQARVEAGIEQLRAEKAGVEAKVRERTHELSQSNEQLAALNSEKDTFLGICSHDLKNPLSAVIGLAGLLEEDAESPADVRSHAADIRQSADFMLSLVTRLLDIGALEQGKFHLTPELINLNSIVAGGAEGYRRRAESKGIRLEITAPSEAVMVLADAHATQQIVENLVSNALKFTPREGSVHVIISASLGEAGDGPDGAGPGFAVRDSGPGLSPCDQAKLFQKYTRLSPRATGGESSTGLGLSIVKQLVQAMHGTVACQSQLGQGCTFTVVLPVAASPASP